MLLKVLCDTASAYIDSSFESLTATPDPSLITFGQPLSQPLTQLSACNVFVNYLSRMSDPPNTFIDLTKDESSSSKPVNQTSFPITVPKDVGLQQEKADESLSDVGFNVGFPLMMSDSMKSGTSIINNVVSSELQCAADESAILEQPSLQLSSILKSQPNPQQGWLAALSQRTLERVHLSSSPIVLPTSKIGRSSHCMLNLLMKLF